MKTLSMYIRAAKTEAEEAGIETDGMAASVSKLRDEILRLTGGKVDIQLDEKNFKSSFQILKEISEIWDEIGEKSGSVAQANLLNLLGGKRNANVLASLINNFEDAIAASKTAANSMGSAYLENEKYLDSIEGKTKQVQASFEAFANSVIHSDLVKAFADIAKAVLDVARGLSDVGMLIPVIATLGSVLRGISSAVKAGSAFSLISNILGGTGDLTAKLNSINSVIAGLSPRAASILTQSLNTLSPTTAGLQQVQQAAANASVSITGLGTAATRFGAIWKNLGSIVGNGLIIGAIVAMASEGIRQISNAMRAERDARDAAINNAKEINDAYAAANATYKENTDRINELKERYQELSASLGKGGTQGKLSTSEYKEYLSIVKELMNISPGLIGAYNAQGQALKDNNDIIQAAIKYQEDLLKSQRDTYLAGGEEQFAGYASTIRDIRDQLDDLNEDFSRTIFESIPANQMAGIDELINVRQQIAQAFADMGYDTSGATDEGWLPWDIESSMKTVGESLSLYENMEEILGRLAALRREVVDEQGAEPRLIPLFTDEQIAQMRNNLRAYATLWQQYNDVNDEVFQYIYTYFKTDMSDMYDKLPAERLGEFQQLLSEALMPEATLESNKKIAANFAEAYIQAIGDIGAALASGNMEAALENLRVKYQNFPSILRMVEAELGVTSDAASQTTYANDELTKSYEELAKAMDDVSKATSFLEKARKGESSTFDMIKQAQEFVETYAKMKPGDEITMADIMSVGDDGKIVWDTESIRAYVEEIIRLQFAESEFAKQHPEVVNALVDEATAFVQAEKAAASFSDALQSVSNTADLLKAVDSFSGADSEMFSILGNVQQIVDSWNQIRDADNQIDASYFIDFKDGAIDFTRLASGLDAYKDAVFDSSKAMQELEGKFPGIIDYLKQMDPAAEQATREVLSLSDAMSSFGDIMEAKFSGTLGGNGPIEMLEKALKYGETWAKLINAGGGDVGNQWADLLIIDENGIRENVDAIEAMYTDLIDFIVNNEELDLSDEQRNSLKNFLSGWISDNATAEEAKKTAEKVKDAFSGIKDAYDYMHDISEFNEGNTSFFDMLQNAYSLAEKYEGISLGDLLRIGDDGTVEFLDVTDAVLDSMIKTVWDAIPAAEQAKTTYEDFAKTVKDSFQQAAEEIDRFDTATQAINTAGSLNSFLEDSRGGNQDVLHMLSSAVSLAKDLGVAVEDIVSVENNQLVYDLDKLTSSFNTYIDDLVEAGNLNADLAAQIKAAAVAEGELAAEAQTTAERMASTLSSMKSLYGFMQSGTAGETDILDVLIAAQAQFDDYQQKLEEGFRGKPRTILDFLKADGLEVKENVDTARDIYRDYANQLVNAWMEELRIANRESGAEVIRIPVDSAWQNGLTAEQIPLFAAILNQISAPLNNLNKDTEETVGDIIGNLNTLVSFQAKSGERVDFSSIYDEVEKLKTVLGDAGKDLTLTNFIHWDDDIGDFVYQADILESKADELANSVIASLGLTGDAAVKAAATIKASLGGAATTFSKLSTAIGRVKSVQSFAKSMQSYQSGEAGFLDMLSDAVSIADDLGLELQQVAEFDEFGGVTWHIEAMNAAVDASIDKLVNEKRITQELADQLKAAARSYNEAVSAAEQLNEKSNTATSVLSGASSYGRDVQLTYKAFQELTAQDQRFASAVEYVNGQLVINKDRYAAVTEEIARETIAMARLQAAQDRLQIDKLVEEYGNLEDKESERAKAIQAEISRLNLEINGYKLLASELENATDAFARFNSASSSTEGSMHAAAQEAYNIIKDTLENEKSDRYQMFGNEKFKASVELVLGGIDTEGPEYERAMATLKRYFADDRDGVINFYNDLIDASIIDAATGAFDTTIGEISSRLGITQDAARAMMQQLEQYANTEFDWSKLDPDAIDTAAESARTLAEKLEEDNKLIDEAQQKKEAYNNTEMVLNDEQAIAAIASMQEGLQHILDLIGTIKQTPVEIRYIASSGMSDGGKTMEELFKDYMPENYNGNVDLARRVIVPLNMLPEFYWEGKKPSKFDYATLLSETFRAGNPAEGYEFEYDQNVVLNFTPITADGQYIDDLPDYVASVIEESSSTGRSIKEIDAENLNLLLSVGVVEEGTSIDEATEDAVAYAQRIHELQEAWDAFRAQNNFFGEAATLDPYGVFASLQADISAAQSGVDTLTDSTAAPKSDSSAITKLTSSIQNAWNFLMRLNGSKAVVTVEKREISTGGDNGNTGAAGSFVGQKWGFAGARGSFRAKGGRTLVGELGKELVVDPAKNRWYTVGDHGAEFVNLPDGAIVFNHMQTAQLLGETLKGKGKSFASGNARAFSGKSTGVFVIADGGSGVKKPTTKAKDIKTTGVVQLDPNKMKPAAKKAGDAVQSVADKLKALKDALDAVNNEYEHYIKHVEADLYVAERAADFQRMTELYDKEAAYYKKIYDQSMQAVRNMQAAGATDTSEELQAAEEAAWSAYQSMFEAIDKMRSLRVDEIGNEIDRIQGAFKTLSDAAEEYNSVGGMSVDTFQSLLDNGIQYLALTDRENGQIVLNNERLQEYLRSRKEQLAIETALSYIDRIREGLMHGETQRVRQLVDATNTLSTGTWNLVYANTAALKASGLSNDQYQRVLENINKLRDIAQSVNTDLLDAGNDLSKQYDKQKDALDKILDYTEQLIRAEAKDRVDAINKEIDAYKEIVRLKKESLDTTRKENEYEESVAEKVKEIAEMQAKADMLSLDNTREAAAERQSLLQQIMDAQKELADFQGDYALDAQQEALDKEAESYEEARQTEIEAIEDSVSSVEKVYRLALIRIRDNWNTLFDDLINWNTEQGNVINQEIVDNWELACKAVQKYGTYIEALAALQNTTTSTGKLVIADIPKYHGGGVAGDKGKLNDDEVLAVLQKGELVVDRAQKSGLYTVIDFVKTLGERLGVALDNIRELRPSMQMMPAIAGTAVASAYGTNETNNISFSPTFNVSIAGGDMSERTARDFGREVAETAANNLFDAFSRRGIQLVNTLRQ